jgi:hypothetical protein
LILAPRAPVRLLSSNAAEGSFRGILSTWLHNARTGEIQGRPVCCHIETRG